MGQYWMVLNLDKHETHGHQGKLGENFFYGGFQRLMMHFRRYESSGVTPEPVILVENENADPADDDKDTEHKSSGTRVSVKQSKPSPPSTLGDLERIPTEIILKILEGISNNVDLISFSLTNTILYFFGYDILQKRYLENGKADWEGDRLICVGDYADFRDLPPNLYTEDELKNICSDFKLKSTKPQQRPIDIICERWQSPYDLASEKWKSVRKHYGLTSQKKVIFEHLKITKQPHMCTNALALLRTAFKDFPYTDENPPVLCNISKRVYVNIKDYYNTKSGISWMDILASNICWSSDPSSAMRYDVTRGKWAGDRFALRPLSQLHELGGEGDWKNITEGELKRIRRIARECQV